MARIGETRTLAACMLSAGVEVGQLVVVAVAIPIIALLARSPYGASLKRGIAWLILGAGVFWLAERTAGLLGA